jgi:hypothetical protein
MANSAIGNNTQNNFYNTPMIGSRVLAVGHSFLTGGGASHADRQYITLLSGMWRSDLIDEGVGGSEIAYDEGWLVNETTGGTSGKGGWATVLQSVYPSRSVAPYSPATWLPLIHTGINDLMQHSHDASGNPRTIFKTGLRTVMSRMCTARLFTDTDSTIAYGGITWGAAKIDNLKNTGTQYRPIPGNTATVTITLPADIEAGTVALGFTVWPTSDGSITLSGTASGATGTYSLAGLAYAAGNTAAARRNSSNGHVIRIPVTASDASKTIIATYGSGSGTTFSSPGTSTVSNVGTAGATTYTYTRVYRTYNGDTIPSSTFSTTTGNSTLSATNYNSIAAGAAWPSGVEAELIVRTVGGTQQGIIATLTTGPAVVTDKSPTVASGGLGYVASTVQPLTGGAAFDYWQIEAANPVTKGIIVNIHRCLSYSNSASDTDVANYNADIQSVIAEFPAGQWLYVDIDSALNKNSAYFVADGLHANDRGHALIAATIHNAVNAWQQSWAMTDIAHQSRVMKRVTSRNILLLSPGKGTDYVLANGMQVIDTALQVAIDAQVGDDLEVTLSGMWGVQATTAGLDLCTLTSGGSAINFFSSGTSAPLSTGYPCFYNSGTAALAPLSGTAIYTVQPADIQTVFTVPGIVIVQLRGTSTAGTKVLYGGGTVFSSPLMMQVRNVGNRNNGFNGS